MSAKPLYRWLKPQAKPPKSVGTMFRDHQAAEEVNRRSRDRWQHKQDLMIILWSNSQDPFEAPQRSPFGRTKNSNVIAVRRVGRGNSSRLSCQVAIPAPKVKPKIPANGMLATTELSQASKTLMKRGITSKRRPLCFKIIKLHLPKILEASQKTFLEGALYNIMMVAMMYASCLSSIKHRQLHPTLRPKPKRPAIPTPTGPLARTSCAPDQSNICGLWSRVHNAPPRPS